MWLLIFRGLGLAWLVGWGFCSLTSFTFSFLFYLDVELLSYCGKNFLNVESSLGTSFKDLVKFVFLSEFDCTLVSDLSLLLHFALVANEIHAHILTRMLLDLLQPVEQVHEGLLPGHIVGQEYAVSASVEDARHRFEGFLTCCVPDLQLDHLALDTESKGTEFNSDCHLMLHLEFVVHNTFHEARLAHSSVSNDNQLEKVILGGQRLVGYDLMRQTSYDIVLCDVLFHISLLKKL